MEKKKQKQEVCQIVLLVLSGILMLLACFSLLSNLAIENSENGRRWPFGVFFSAASLLISVVNWKKQPVWNTVMIGLWSCQFGMNIILEIL